MNLPDVTGYSFERAVQILKAAGAYQFDVEVLNPPRCGETAYDNRYRVVRTQFPDGSRVKLLICKPL